MKKILIASTLALILTFNLNAQPKESDQEKGVRMEWFQEAKLGIFIHWGIYAVEGISESWSFYNGYLSHEDYMKQLDGFTASAYQPKEWVKLIEQSGAQYAVITTKHHDGVALWETDQNHYNVIENTPAGTDLIEPFVKALRKNDLKVGLYYSLIDWSHPDYPNHTRELKRYKEDSLRWERFVNFNIGQIKEISGSFNPDLVWFDGDWEFNAEQWHAIEIRELLMKQNPGIIINSRLRGYGDYATPEQGAPLHKPKDLYWELCMTMNDSWGFQHNDKNYKSTNQIIQIFADCIGKGGNLLLDIGPKEDGSIPPEQVEILEGLGRWTKKHEKAIYNTRAGLPSECFYGPTTLSEDSTKLYLFLPYKPSGSIALKGVKNRINSSWVLGNGTHLEPKLYLKPYWSSHAGVYFIDIPEDALDEEMTVVTILLDGKLKL
jgi:alpha-L-fucosidase